MKLRKLYSLTPISTRFPIAFPNETDPIEISAENIPMLTWPDGSWCFWANAYMINLFNRGLSRQGKGGTLGAYASNLTHLIRFCYQNKLDFTDLDDNYFSLFIRSLSSYRGDPAKEERTRDNNSIISIGRTCLDLLKYISQVTDETELISKTGKISVDENKYIIRGRVIKSSFHHRSFPLPSAFKKRSPISDSNLHRLIEACFYSSSIFLRHRRLVMLKLLDITGCRRSELVRITVHDIYLARKSEHNSLKIPTVKQGGNSLGYRHIPLAAHDLDFIVDFIEKHRSKVLRKIEKSRRGIDTVLISETTGQALSPNTITQEIFLLSQYAKLEERISPHLFRHRFITSLFIELVKRHQTENSDSFRSLLLSSETLKKKIQEWTGHKNPESLDVYIDLAFESISNSRSIIDNALRSKRIISLQDSIYLITQDIRSGAGSQKILGYFESIRSALDDLH
ncbi:site-specific integrase [Pseudomonas aeruginosa]|nr:site-specific integrase [Pseudomonas aeruginosa]